MDNELYIWSEGFRGYKQVKGVPPSTETVIRSSINGSPGEWTLYIPNYHSIPPEGEHKFPDELYYEIRGNSSNIKFDYLGWNGKCKIVSERMLFFLKEHGITENYETAMIKSVINRSGKIIETQHQYYAIRFYKYDDDLINFPLETAIVAKVGKGKRKIYPDMTIKEDVAKEIFIIYEFVYQDSIVFTERIKKEIESRKFIGPVIYPATEFHFAYNGN